MKKKVKFRDITIKEALNICFGMASCDECPCEITENNTRICRLINTFNHKDDKYLEDEIEIEENENEN